MGDQFNIPTVVYIPCREVRLPGNACYADTLVAEPLVSRHKNISIEMNGNTPNMPIDMNKLRMWSITRQVLMASLPCGI